MRRALGDYASPPDPQCNAFVNRRSQQPDWRITPRQTRTTDDSSHIRIGRAGHGDRLGSALVQLASQGSHLLNDVE
jgi:hypothetical protein